MRKELRCGESCVDAFGYIGGFQNFSHRVPFVGPVLSPLTTFHQETQSTKYHSIKSWENHN